MSVNWTEVRGRLVTAAAGRFEITERMTVADIEEELLKISGDPLVTDALEWLECQKKRAAGLAQHQEWCGTQDIHKLPLLSRLVYVARRHLTLLLQDAKQVFCTQGNLHQSSCVSPNVKVSGCALAQSASTERLDVVHGKTASGMTYSSFTVPVDEVARLEAIPKDVRAQWSAEISALSHQPHHLVKKEVEE